MKNAADENATLWNAFNQLQTYKQQIPTLFTWNAAHRDATVMLKRYGRHNIDDHPSSLSPQSWQALRERPWREEDEGAPLSAYGATKLAGDAAVRAAGGPSLILRTSWVYAAQGKNFLRTIARAAPCRPFDPPSPQILILVKSQSFSRRGQCFSPNIIHLTDEYGSL